MSDYECRRKILSEDFLDIITDYPILQVDNPDYCVLNLENRFSLVYYDKTKVTDKNSYFYDYRSVPNLYALMEDWENKNSGGSFHFLPLTQSGITQVQREPLKLTGRGCVMVFIDTGIDYTNPLFRRQDGTTRIAAIWDQTIQSGTPPEGLPFGSEYSREDIDRALQAIDPYEVVPSRDENGHGTNMAAIAAGSKIDRIDSAIGLPIGADAVSFLGAAPDAEIVVVKLKECKSYLKEHYLIPDGVTAYEETDILLAAFYADRFAVTFRKPVIFCLGIGTNAGDHKGSSLLSRYLDYLAVKRSRAIVVCGGNEGNANHHYAGKLDNRGNVIHNEETVELRVGEGAEGFVLEFWGNIPDAFTIALRSPGGETIPPVRLGLAEAITYSFIYERTRITVAGELVEPASGEELIQIRFQAPTTGIWTITVSAVGEIHNGEFHMWLPVTQFMNTEVMFLRPSPYITLTEPSLAENVISVSNYNAVNNSFYVSSGRGFSNGGTMKPDFAAPGVNLSGAFGQVTGSSYGAAITAGAVAQFMQWAVVEGNKNVVESREIKNYFARGAKRTYTREYPNTEWGYGRLDVTGTFDALIGV